MIKRTLLPDLRKHLSNQEITMIVGSRQAGKTTLLKALQEELKAKGEKTVFFSLDDDSHSPYFDSQDNLLNKISLEVGKTKGYIFIDEIQRKENAGLFLKGLYDRELPHKFIVTGSGSIELKEKIQESLAGRKRLFELSTLSFFEFVNFKTSYKYEDNLIEFFNVEKNKTESLMEEYLNFGGYPKVVLRENLEEKRFAITDIYQSYIEKDIAYLLNIQKTESLTNLVRLLASQAGNLVNVAKISSTLGISEKTVNEYMWYLEKTFIIERITPFFRNVRKEITKSPTIYFHDLGMKNYATRQFGTEAINAEKGFLFQNFIFLMLMEKIEPPISIHFWRTQDKAKVDFVVDFGQKIIPIEVKYTKLTDPELTRSFRSFISKYKPKKAVVVHLGNYFQEQIDQTKVIFCPFTQFQDLLYSES